MIKKGYYLMLLRKPSQHSEHIGRAETCMAGRPSWKHHGCERVNLTTIACTYVVCVCRPAQGLETQTSTVVCSLPERNAKGAKRHRLGLCRFQEFNDATNSERRNFKTATTRQ